MKLLKENSKQYLPFLNSLDQLEKSGNGKYYLKVKKNIPSSINLVNVFSGGNVNVDLLDFSEKLRKENEQQELLTIFTSEVKKLSFFSNPEIFLLDQKSNSFFPLNKNCNVKTARFVKDIFQNGIADWIAEKSDHKIIPWNDKVSEEYREDYCLLIPLYNGDKFNGLFISSTQFKYLSDDSFEYKVLKTILNLTVSKIESLSLRNEINKTYSDIQLLQSKHENDFKYTAVGELTTKSLQEIASPLQVILSYISLLESESPGIDESVTQMIKKQVFNIKEILERLGKFTSEEKNKKKVQSCSINRAVNDFYKLIEHALISELQECVLDLEENIPPILSNYNSLKQILISAFSLINPLRNRGGGIIIQTRYANENILLKMVFTEVLDSLSDEDKKMGLKILDNLMIKHEGEFKFDSNPGSGTTLVFSFPLKRKNRI